MDTLNYLLIPMILFIGVVTSIEDYKKNIVKNKWVALSIGYGLFVTIGFSLFLYFSGNEFNLEYVKVYFLNIMFTSMAAIIIWLSGLWPPGDAKLLIAYSALMPLSIYEWGSIRNFPSFTILINIFVPIFIVYFIRIMIKTTWTDKKNIVKAITPKMLLENITFIVPIMWIMKKMSQIQHMEILGNIFVVVIFIFALMLLMKNFMKDKLGRYLFIATCLIIILDYNVILTKKYAQEFTLVFIYFIIIRYIIINLSILMFSKKTFIEDLKPGMILMENYFIINNVYTKRLISPVSFVNGLMDNTGKRLIKNLSNGLSKSDVKKLKEMHSEGTIEDHEILVGQTVPFAPYMFVGILLTILFKGNIVIAILKLLG